MWQQLHNFASIQYSSPSSSGLKANPKCLPSIAPTNLEDDASHLAKKLHE
jgi:hypothetical protein